MQKPETTELARKLRSEPSEEETLLWSKLRSRRLGVKFRRQSPVRGYIVDFLCPSLKLIVEVAYPNMYFKRWEERRGHLQSAGYTYLSFGQDYVRKHPSEVVARIQEFIRRS